MKRVLLSEYLVLLLCGALFAILAPFTPGLATAGTAVDLLGNLAPLLVVAVGETLVLVAGGGWAHGHRCPWLQTRGVVRLRAALLHRAWLAADANVPQ